jgi:hypothetical protein
MSSFFFTSFLPERRSGQPGFEAGSPTANPGVEQGSDGLVQFLEGEPQGTQLLGEQPHHQSRDLQHGRVGGEGLGLANLAEAR